MNSSYKDLHQIFRHNITARSIAEPLVSFAARTPTPEALSIMDQRGFDVVGVREQGQIIGFAERTEIQSVSFRETVGQYGNPLEKATILNESDPLLETLEALKDSSWVFISFLERPSAIVTRGDLQKAPVRMWLFGLISMLESLLLTLIRTHSTRQDWWTDLISLDRLNSAKSILDHRKKRNEETDLVDCLQICDKVTIFSKTASLLSLTGCKSKADWRKTMTKTEELRNALAHSNELETQSWPNTADLALQWESIIKNLESKR